MTDNWMDDFLARQDVKDFMAEHPIINRYNVALEIDAAEMKAKLPEATAGAIKDETPLPWRFVYTFVNVLPCHFLQLKKFNNILREHLAEAARCEHEKMVIEGKANAKKE